LLNILPNYFPVVAEAFIPRDPVALVERVGDCAISAPFLGLERFSKL
jgi:hypothetical protein